MMRPGPVPRTWTRLDRKMASSIEWVTSTMVLPVRCQISSSEWLIASRVMASSAPNGSSISSTLGSSARARAIATRWRMPPESSFGRLWPASPRPTRASMACAALAQLGPRQRLVADAEQQGGVVARGLPGQQIGVLEHQPDLPAFAPPRPGTRPLSDTVPLVGVDETRHGLQQRALAAAGRADQRHEGALLDRERHVLQHALPLAAPAQHDGQVFDADQVRRRRGAGPG